MTKVLPKTGADLPPGTIDVGRGSPWNNPFRIPFDGDRATVLAKHERWLAENPDLLRGLDELRDRDLACEDAPLPSHADLLLRLAAMSWDERLAWAQGVART